MTVIGENELLMAKQSSLFQFLQFFFVNVSCNKHKRDIVKKKFNVFVVMYI